MELTRLTAADRERRDAAPAAVARLAAAREWHVAAVGVERYDETAKRQAVAAHERAAEARAARPRLTATLDATADLDSDVAGLVARRDLRRARQADVDREIAELDLDPGALARRRKAAGAAREACEDATAALHEAKLRAQERDQTAKTLRGRLDEGQAAHQHLQGVALQARQHGIAGRLLSDYRSVQHQRAWPKLEEGASRLPSDATDGRYADVRLSEDYKLVIVDRGEAHGLERYSGGEQDLAHLCLRLAIAEWVSRERGVELGFAVLDEVSAARTTSAAPA